MERLDEMVNTKDLAVYGMWLLLKKAESLLVMVLYPEPPVMWLLERLSAPVLTQEELPSRTARVREMGSNKRVVGNNRKSPIWPLFPERRGPDA